jgi:N6-adenosine-specific RNA methylase IME4
MEEHKLMLICRRVSELAVPSSGAKKDVCEECSCEVWVSEKSRQRKKDLGAKVFCAACAFELVKDQEHLVLGTEGQFKGINKEPSVREKGIFLPVTKTTADPDKILRMAKEGASDEELKRELYPPPERN